MVDSMEVDLSTDERMVVESYQTLIKSGMTPAQAAIHVSSSTPLGCNFTPRVHKELDRIIKDLEDPKAADL